MIVGEYRHGRISGIDRLKETVRLSEGLKDKGLKDKGALTEGSRRRALDLPVPIRGEIARLV